MSFYACREMFQDLAALADRHQLQMTCYIDDVAMSGVNASPAVLREARALIFREGLTAHKDRYFDPKNSKLVTGVIVHSDGISLPHSRWKKIKTAIAELTACGSDDERLAIYPRLVSRLYEAAQIDPKCRKLAEFHHNGWRLLKGAPPKAASI